MDEPTMPIEEARRIIHDKELTHNAHTMFAAATLMDACEYPELVSFEDMLRCLDYRGAIAEMGARCLYVRTGRDGLGWNSAGSNGLPFIVSRSDWEDYLQRNSFI